MSHTPLKKARAWADTSPDLKQNSLRSIAWGVIAIAESLETFVKNDVARWDREITVIPGFDEEDK